MGLKTYFCQGLSDIQADLYYPHAYATDLQLDFRSIMRLVLPFPEKIAPYRRHRSQAVLGNAWR